MKADIIPPQAPTTAPVAVQSFQQRAKVIGSTAQPMQQPIIMYTQPRPMPRDFRIVAMMPLKMAQKPMVRRDTKMTCLPVALGLM